MPCTCRAPGADGGERIGDRVAGVVVRVDAEPLARNDVRDLADDPLDLVGQRSAVGVAEHGPARAGVDRGLSAGERIFRVGPEAVEEMLAVDHRLAARRDGRLDAVGDRFEVLVERAAERDMDVIVPALGDEDDRVGIGGEQTREAGIVAGRASGALGHAEGAEARALRRLRLEEFGVERVRARIAALDIVDAEPIEHARRRCACRRARSRRRSSARRRAEWCRKDRGVLWHMRALNVGSAAPVRRRAFWSWWCWRAIRRRCARDCAFWAMKPMALEQRPRDVARFDREALGAARASEPCQRVNQRGARALAGKFGIDEEHVDFVSALEARETRDRAVDDGNQCQRARESQPQMRPRRPHARPRPRAGRRRNRPPPAPRCSREKSRRSVWRRREHRGAARRRSSPELPGRARPCCP